MTHERTRVRQRPGHPPLAVRFRTESDGCWWVADNFGRRGPKSHSRPKAWLRWLASGWVSGHNLQGISQ